MYSRCLCLSGKIRPVRKRLKHMAAKKEVKAQWQYTQPSTRPGERQITRQWETEAVGKEMIGKDF